MSQQIEKVLKNLKSRNINGYLVRNKAEAKELVLSLIDTSQRVSWGGSKTIEDIGVLDELKSGKYKVVDRDSVSDFNTRQFVMKHASTEGIFISGTNALTENGQIVNMDGRGNRVNSITYGPDKVIIVVGKNKIVKDLDMAMLRIANIASPPNTKRLNKKTPCAKTGKCMDCRSPERICNYLSIVQFQTDPNRMHIIIVDEELGF
jgi:L-lactate utilization protein LutB